MSEKFDLPAILRVTKREFKRTVEDQTNATRYFIVAGNHRQFVGYCRKNNIHPKNARYVTEPRDLRGLNYGATDIKIIFIGNWYEKTWDKDFAYWLIDKGYADHTLA